MRILIDAHFIDDIFQGGRTYVKELHTAIFELEAADPTGNIYFLAANDIDKLRVEFPQMPFIRYVKLSGSSFNRLVFEFPRIIRDNNIDFAHFQYVVPFIKNCRFVNTIHDLVLLEHPALYSLKYYLPRKWLFKRSYKKTDVVIAVSEYTHKQVLRFYGTKKAVTVVPNAIDSSFFNFKPAISKTEWLDQHKFRPYIFYVSRFDPRKNHHKLIQAYVASGLYKTHDLVLIGKRVTDYPQLDAVLSSIPADIRKSIIINNDTVDNDELKYYLKYAELFVYPSLGEGFGIPPLEAAVMRTPVICANNTAMSDFDFFGDGLIDTENEEILMQTMKKMIAAPPTREVLEHIRESIANRYSWKKSAATFLSALTKK